MNKKWVKRIVVLLIILSAAFYIYKNQTKPIDATYTKLVTKTYDDNLMASAIVAADQYVQLNPKVSSQITAINVQVGDMVSQGQIVASFDSSNTQRDIKAKSAVVEVSKTSLDSLSTSRQLAKENLEKLQVQLKNLQDDLQRKEDLYENEVIPKVELEDAKQKVEEKTIEINSAKISLDSYQKDGSETNKAKANLNQAKIQLENAESTISDYNLVSPVYGIVTAVNQSVGEVSNPSKSIVEIAKGNKKIVKIDIDENYLPFIKIGQDIKIFRQGETENPIISKIDFISPTVNKEKGTVEVKSYLSKENQDKFLFDSDVTVSLLAKRYQNAKILDTKYIFVKDSKKYVYIYDDGKAKEKEIKTKGFGKKVMVTSGLNEKDKILLPENIKENKKISLSIEDKEV